MLSVRHVIIFVKCPNYLARCFAMGSCPHMSNVSDSSALSLSNCHTKSSTEIMVEYISNGNKITTSEKLAKLVTAQSAKGDEVSFR